MQQPMGSQPGSQPEQDQNYWPSVGIAAFLFGFVAFAIQIISGYLQINAEPTGSLFSPVMLFGLVVCLVAAFGGMVAIWHYAREYNVSLKLGKGALIGFLTGVGITLVTIVFSQVWEFIDPDFTQKMIDSTVANFEAMDMPEEQKQQMIDSAVSQFESSQSIGRQLLIGIPLYGILNLLTGMIGVKLFAKEKSR